MKRRTFLKFLSALPFLSFSGVTEAKTLETMIECVKTTNLGGIPPGTVFIFNQTDPPVGWSKIKPTGGIEPPTCRLQGCCSAG